MFRGVLQKICKCTFPDRNPRDMCTFALTLRGHSYPPCLPSAAKVQTIIGWNLCIAEESFDRALSFLDEMLMIFATGRNPEHKTPVPGHLIPY